MSQIKQVIEKLEKVKDATEAMYEIRNPDRQPAGLSGDAAIALQDGIETFSVTQHKVKLSNHQKLESIAALDRLKSRLSEVAAALASVFPQRYIEYRFTPASGKHTLVLDNQHVLEAVASTWKQQLPQIQRVFHSDTPNKIWLIDQFCQTSKKAYQTQSIVHAPTLATAMVQRQFTDMTLSERKQASPLRNLIFAAAELVPAETTTPEVNHDFDADSAAAAWEIFRTNVGKVAPAATSRMKYLLNAGPDIETDLSSDITLHPLLHEDEIRQEHSNRMRIKDEFERFAEILKMLAPSTTFAIELDIYGTRKPAPSLRIGRITPDKTTEIVEALRVSEETGHASRKLHVVRSGTHVELIDARTAAEALENFPKYSIPGSEAENAVIYIAKPLSKAFINAEIEKIDAEWDARRRK
jgi:hypothetical protein